MVRRLTASEWPAGRHSVEWDGQDANGRDVPPGAYFVRIEALGRTGTAKVILAR
jgi:flagellar hook assembly protein FlgD